MPDDLGVGFTVSNAPDETKQQTIARLAALEPLEYDALREREAKRLTVRVSTLDGEVAKARAEAGDDATTDRMVALADHVPWSEPVTAGEILDALASAILRHLILAPEAADAIALWIVHTWVYERFEHTPRLTITSPTRRCGKSTLLDVLRLTCRRTLKADNISASGMFRTVEALAPLTMLIDEADSFLNENEELRGILNSGFERSGAVIRVVEIRGEHRPVQFATFAPCALAAIGALPGTLADRSLPIRLERKGSTEVVTKLRDGRSRATLTELGRKLARFAADHGNDLIAMPTIPIEMGDREGDICVPLLAIADHAGSAWATRARHALLALFTSATEAEASTENGVLLLGDISAIFTEKGAHRIPSTDLCVALGNMETRPWPEWQAGKPITPTQVARVLKPFKMRPFTYRPPGGKPVKGYQRDHFAEAWERYLPPRSRQSTAEQLPGNNVDKNYEFAEHEAVTSSDVLPAGNQKKSSQGLQCYRVTDESPPR